jgi:hypothetical protein
MNYGSDPDSSLKLKIPRFESEFKNPDVRAVRRRKDE